MGWASGKNFKGEEIGYSVTAVCAERGCNKPINKGLAYCCGDLDGVQGERGCGGYFCSEHLFFGGFDGQRCSRCADAEPDEDEGDDSIYDLSPTKGTAA